MKNHFPWDYADADQLIQVFAAFSTNPLQPLVLAFADPLGDHRAAYLRKVAAVDPSCFHTFRRAADLDVVDRSYPGIALCHPVPVDPLTKQEAVVADHFLRYWAVAFG